jgi:methionine synthase II (cobalamin-independent)
MNRSTDRILVTHAGSLPRPDDLIEMIWARMDGQPVDEAALEQHVASAIDEVVRQQLVLAGTGCGFDTFIRFSQVDPDVAWLKLRALAEGAALASDTLY